MSSLLSAPGTCNRWCCNRERVADVLAITQARRTPATHHNLLMHKTRFSSQLNTLIFTLLFIVILFRLIFLRLSHVSAKDHLLSSPVAQCQGVQCAQLEESEKLNNRHGFARALQRRMYSLFRIRKFPTSSRAQDAPTADLCATLAREGGGHGPLS